MRKGLEKVLTVTAVAATPSWKTQPWTFTLINLKAVGCVQAGSVPDLGSGAVPHPASLPAGTPRALLIPERCWYRIQHRNLLCRPSSAKRKWQARLGEGRSLLRCKF